LQKKLTVVYAKGALEDLCTVEIVDGKDGRALVFVHEKSEASRFPRLGITRHVDVGD
jgi:hypothetical protein